jgi:putative hydrolase of the HAD superfamily
MNPTKRKYKSLFFDLDNTLWDFERNSFFALREAFKLNRLNFEDNKFDQIHSVYVRHNEILWDLYRRQEISKNELTWKRFQKTFEELGITGIEPDEFNTTYLDEMPKQKHLVEGAKEILEYLFVRYKLYIITNGFREVQFKKLENAELSRYFKKVFISEDIKAPKPNPEFFEYAIKSANARKKESLIIGDDWDVDIMGAHNFGIDQVFYSRENVNFEEFDGNFNNKPTTYKINRLNQLSSFL